MRKKVLPFSLFEVIIATSLFAILLFSTTSLFFRYHKLSAKIATIRPKVFERALFFDKMTEMTESIDASTIETVSDDHDKCLIFEFDNGFKDNASFSGKCTCTVYKTIDNKLIYKLVNQEGQELVRPILLEVESFNAQFENGILTLKIKDHFSETTTQFIISNSSGKGVL